MINHSPAQLIAELERLMDMDYERLPGARHVLEEAIAVIRPLAEKPGVGEMIDPLRALVAHWRERVRGHRVKPPGSNVTLAELNAAYADIQTAVLQCAAELDALLSGPVGSPPPPPEKKYGCAPGCTYSHHGFHVAECATGKPRASAQRGGGETRLPEEKP